MKPVGQLKDINIAMALDWKPKHPQRVESAMCLSTESLYRSHRVMTSFIRQGGYSSKLALV